MNPVTVSFDGEQTIRTITEAAHRLRGALAQGGPVEVECSGIVEVDLSFVQLLLAARKTARRMGTSLTLTDPGQGALQACLRAGGLLHDHLDGSGATDARFWMKKGEA